MRFVRLVATYAAGIAAVSNGRAFAQRPSAPADTALRADLLRRVALDQAVRDTVTAAMRRGGAPDSALVARMAAVDAANTAWITRVLARGHWPGRSAVGADGAGAAFLLVQHADRDTALQARALRLLEAAHRAGEAEGQDLALLTDRVAVARKRPQVYGTQADLREGRVVLAPVVDSARLDARRAAVGLPPLRDYLRMLDSLYTPAGRP